MMRPKRAAAQKAKEKPAAKDSSRDENLDLSEESDGDFSSASSDEYDPGKEKGVEETFEESESEIEEEGESSFADESPQKSKSKRVSVVSTLRGTTSSKYKRAHTNGSKSIQDILQRSQFQKKKSILNDSSTKEKTPEFDCSGGLRLSDSSGSESDERPTTSAKAIQHDKKKSTKLIDSINHASGSSMFDLKKNHDNLLLIEQAKANMMKYQSSEKPAEHQKENFNIAELLLMGEDAPAEQPKPQKKSASQKRAHNDSDSDDGWEEVEDEANAYKVPSQGVEILLNNQQEKQLKNVKKVDLEAQMKRKLNRQRKEYQVTLHKTSLVAWVVHCTFVNRKLNDTNLMAGALKLLPKNKNHCYPTDETDLDYFRQITKWFKSTIALRNQEMYCAFKPLPPLMMSLALQIKFKAAICRRDYVLIFIILLRAIGVQCRMVQSLVLAPILPPKSALISLAANPTTSRNQTKSNAKPTNSKSSGSKQKNLAIPQLDGGDDRASRSRARRPIKIKGASGSEVQESFIDINKNDTVVEEPKSSKKTRSKSKQSTKNSPRTTMSPKVRFAMDSPNRIATSPSEKLFKSSLKNKQTAKGPVNSLKENEKGFSPLKTRAMRNVPQTSSTAASSKTGKAPTKPILKAPKVQTEDSPTSSKSPSILKSSTNAKSLSAKSPTSSKSPTKPTTASKSPSKDQPKSSAKAPVVKDTLKVFSPRRLRSRSRSSNDEGVSPNLKKLNGAGGRKRSASDKPEIVETKKPKASPQSAGEKRRNADKEDKVQTKKPKPNGEKKEVQKSAAKAAKDDTESDYEGDTDESEKLFKKKPMKKTFKALKEIDRRVVSTDSEADFAPRKSNGIDIWVELYSEKDKRWIAIDILKGKVDCVKDIVKTATHPMVYVFAINNDNSLKDVSARYCPNLCTTVRKMRVDNKYLDATIGRYQGIKTARDLKEDEELNSLLMEHPMPKSIAQFKNHPLFALKRHLLKYEAIYPPEPPILGYIRDEAIYPRDSVFVLHTRETWLKEARVVKLNEKPYKMSTTLKWDNVSRKLLKDIPQELYGIWQTKDFEPPVAENGMVPRNAYGNVELFKPCMLPKGCVHLQLPGLNKVCKKIGVDCSQAIVGFDSNGGWPFPVYDGFIICEEFEEKVIDAWNREQEEQEKKENEKYEKRVYGNWKKLIKGLLIRQRLKNKYNFEGTES